MFAPPAAPLRGSAPIVTGAAINCISRAQGGAAHLAPLCEINNPHTCDYSTKHKEKGNTEKINMEELPIIAIITAVVALVPATWIPLHIYRARRFDTACDVFCSAFNPELVFLVSDIKSQSSIYGTTYEMLSKALNKHKSAVDVFTRVLPKRKRKGFNKAWEGYLYPNGYNKEADFPLLGYAEGEDFEKRKLAHDKISKLLEFAKLK